MFFKKAKKNLEDALDRLEMVANHINDHENNHTYVPKFKAKVLDNNGKEITYSYPSKAGTNYYNKTKDIFIEDVVQAILDHLGMELTIPEEQKVKAKLTPKLTAKKD